MIRMNAPLLAAAVLLAAGLCAGSDAERAVRVHGPARVVLNRLGASRSAETASAHVLGADLVLPNWTLDRRSQPIPA